MVKNKKRVMFMINGLYGGGAERVLQTILNHLSEEKYDLTLYTMYREVIDSEFYRCQFTYRVVFDTYQGSNPVARRLHMLLGKIKGKFFQLLPSRWFYRLYIRGKYDIEIAFLEGVSTKIIAGSTNRRSRKYAWVHTNLTQNPCTCFLYAGDEDESRHYQAFDRIFCVSGDVRTAFIEKYHIAGDRVGVLYNPIDSEEIMEKSRECTPLQAADCLRMVTAGRLVEQKGYDRLVRVAAKLAEQGLAFELLILGEGEARPMLEGMIRQYGLEERVKLLGYQKNPYAYMKCADLFVCSSRVEGYGTAICESIILGVPVVSTNCSGVREEFGAAKCGIIVENNEDALYEALLTIFHEPGRLAEYRRAAGKRAEFFSLARTISEVEHLLDTGEGTV